VWIWEQTAIISLYNNNWLVCITEMECVYCAVRTGSLYIIRFNLTLRSVHTAVFMCFVSISEQTAIISLHSTKRLVCITETECVYCAIRTGSCIIRFNLTLLSVHTAVFMCFVWISEQTAIISLYSINWLVCTTETECVYCAVRPECLNVIQVNRSHHSTKLHTHLHLQVHVALTRTNGRKLGAFQKECAFGNRGALERRLVWAQPMT